MITRVPCEILANDLVITRVSNCAEQIGRDDFSECGIHRQLFVQETVHNHEVSAVGLGIRKPAGVYVKLISIRYRLETLLRERREIRVLPLLISNRRKTQLLETIHRATPHELEPRRRRRKLTHAAKRRLITVF